MIHLFYCKATLNYSVFDFHRSGVYEWHLEEALLRLRDEQFKISIAVEEGTRSKKVWVEREITDYLAGGHNPFTGTFEKNQVQWGYGIGRSISVRNPPCPGGQTRGSSYFMSMLGQDLARGTINAASLHVLGCFGCSLLLFVLSLHVDTKDFDLQPN